MLPRRPTVLTFLLLGAGSASADSVDLAPLEVTSTRVTSEWLQTPAAVSSVSVADKPGEQMLTLDSLLMAVPGAVPCWCGGSGRNLGISSSAGWRGRWRAAWR